MSVGGGAEVMERAGDERAGESRRRSKAGEEKLVTESIERGRADGEGW